VSRVQDSTHAEGQMSLGTGQGDPTRAMAAASGPSAEVVELAPMQQLAEVGHGLP
jgi:hypothetical protein